MSEFVTTFQEAGKKNIRDFYDSPTAASLFWNIFRNNKAHIPILLLFAGGSGSDLKTTSKVCMQDYLCLSFSCLKSDFLRYVWITVWCHTILFNPVPSKQLTPHCFFCTERPVPGRQFRSWSKKWKTVVLSNTSLRSVTFETLWLVLFYCVCLLLCGRTAPSLYRFRNIVCWFSLLYCFLK